MEENLIDETTRMELLQQHHPRKHHTMYCAAPSLIMSTSPSSVTSAAADISTESITGELSNINDRYVVSKVLLGTGHFGSVRQCTDRITGNQYAVKSISKNNPGLKWGVLAREIILLQSMKHDNIRSASRCL